MISSRSSKNVMNVICTCAEICNIVLNWCQCNIVLNWCQHCSDTCTDTDTDSKLTTETPLECSEENNNSSIGALFKADQFNDCTTPIRSLSKSISASSNDKSSDIKTKRTKNVNEEWNTWWSFLSYNCRNVSKTFKDRH